MHLTRGATASVVLVVLAAVAPMINAEAPPSAE